LAAGAGGDDDDDDAAALNTEVVVIDKTGSILITKVSVTARNIVSFISISYSTQFRTNLLRPFDSLYLLHTIFHI